MADMEFDGFSEQDLQKVVDNVKKTMSKATKYSAIEVRAEIGREAPTDHGKLANPGNWVLEQLDWLTWKLYTNIEYAKWVHEGTGIYGPYGRRITPTNRQALHFYWKSAGQYITVKSVAGRKADPYADRAVQNAQSRAQEFARKAVKEMSA